MLRLLWSESFLRFIKGEDAPRIRELTCSNIITIEEGPEREFVGPHLLTLAEQKDAFAAVMTKLVRLAVRTYSVRLLEGADNAGAVAGQTIINDRPI
jgi:hypothetical protein